jgi:hypothetical protein
LDDGLEDGFFLQQQNNELTVSSCLFFFAFVGKLMYQTSKINTYRRLPLTYQQSVFTLTSFCVGNWTH